MAAEVNLQPGNNLIFYPGGAIDFNKNASTPLGYLEAAVVGCIYDCIKETDYYQNLKSIVAKFSGGQIKIFCSGNPEYENKLKTVIKKCLIIQQLKNYKLYYNSKIV